MPGRAWCATAGGVPHSRSPRSLAAAAAEAGERTASRGEPAAGRFAAGSEDERAPTAFGLAHNCSQGEPAVTFHLNIANVGAGAGGAIDDVHAVWVEDAANPAWSNGAVLPPLPPGATVAREVTLLGLASPAQMAGHHGFTITVNRGRKHCRRVVREQLDHSGGSIFRLRILRPAGESRYRGVDARRAARGPVAVRDRSAPDCVSAGPGQYYEHGQQGRAHPARGQRRGIRLLSSACPPASWCWCGTIPFPTQSTVSAFTEAAARWLRRSLSPTFG